MTKKSMPPTKTETPARGFHDYTLDHPAFGCVIVGHVHSSSPWRLFGSDLGHQSLIRLSFHGATQYRGLSCDRHAPTETLLEVELSEAQWARVVASTGNGSGTPVTINRRRMGPIVDVPGIEAPEASKREIHGEEMAAAVKARLLAMESITMRIGGMLAAGGSIPKTELRELHKELSRHVHQLPGSIQFVYDQFAEATEHVAEDAKTEVEAYVTSVAQRLGFEKLSEIAPRIGNTRSDQA